MKIQALPTLLWVKAELAAVKENRGSIICEVSKTPCLAFNRLNSGIKTFGVSVGDRVFEPCYKVFNSSLQHCGDFLHRLDSAFKNCFVPPRKKTFSHPTLFLLPKLIEVFLECPRFGYFQVEFPDHLEHLLVILRPVFAVS